MCSRSKLAVAVETLCRESRKPQTLALGVIAAVTVLGAAAQAQELEEIMVTGSRLRRDGMSTPTPVTAVDRNELRAMAPTLLMDAINQLPQFRDNDQSQTGSIFSTGGSNSVNLRGVGSNRTLTLLNGRRVVSGQQTGTVDIAMIPTALIDRVEVVTGGASAAYGSDAISGVTNFILNTDFEGFSGDVQTGRTSRSDHDSFEVEIAGGSRIGEHGHLVVSADYYKVDGVYGLRDRAWGQNQWALVTDSASTVPRRFYSPNVNSRVINADGVIASGPLAGTTFLDGQPVQLPQGEAHGSVQIGGGTRDLNLDWQSLAPDDKRSSLFAYYTHEVGDDKEFFVQALRGQHAVTSTPSPTGFAPFWSTQVFADNPYLPASLAQQMSDLGIQSFDFRRVYEQFAATRYVEDNTTSLTFGFDGQIGNDLYLSAYYQHGQNIEYADYNNNYQLPRTDRFYRALDSAIDPATGRITCRANIPAFGGLTPAQEAQVSKFNVQAGRLVYADPLNNSLCVPLNPFAAELPQDVVDYIAGSGNYHHQTIKENIVDVTLQTTLGENRGAGPISLGGGFSFRDESFYQYASGTSRDPRDLPGFGVFSSFVNPADQIPIRGMPATVRDRAIFFTGNPNTRGPLSGDFNVKEIYAESIVPILGTQGGDHVDLHLAARYADYSGSGGVWAWKTGLDWQATDTVRFRGTISRDTRAGTLSERFDVQTGGTPINNGTNTDFLYPDVEQYVAESTVGGNPNVNPELADTVTLGFVYQPSWADNLSLSVDLYDITINDAIAQLGTQEILQRCAAGAQDVCALITRVNADPALIRNIFDIYVNVAEAVTRGADFELSYARPITLIGGQDESIAFRIFANYLDEVSFQFAGAPTLNLAGELDYPEWLLTAMFSYNRGPFSMSWQTRWRDGTIRDVDWIEGIDIADNSVGGRAYTNLNMSYDFQWGGSDVQAYFYVGNLFDEDPPLVAGGIGGTSGQSTYTDNGLFDVLGRTFTVGLRVGL